MTDQKDAFRHGEGDLMFERFRRASKLDDDPVRYSVNQIGVKPKAILEIGCGAGHRLAMLRQEFGAECHGVDPSQMAIEYGRKHYPDLELDVSTAECLSYPDNRFDLVIFGFCLYICDPPDHFRIAWQADRVLQDKGHLVINDFLAPTPYSNEYVHAPSMHSYKMDWSRMFVWNPAYRLISRRYLEDKTPLSFAPDEQICTDLLRKDRGIAFPRTPRGWREAG